MINRRWVENNGCYELHFEKFGIDTIVLKFCRDEKDLNCYWYTFEDLNIKSECNIYESIDKAKEDFEFIYESYLEDEIEYYKDLLKQWNDKE